MKNKISPSITLKIIKNSLIVKQLRTRKSKRIFQFIQAENFSDCIFIVSVCYGFGLNNSGSYATKNDLLNALRMFLEKI